MSRCFAGPTTLITVMAALILSACGTLVAPVPQAKVEPAPPPVSTDKVPTPEDQLAVFSAQLEGIKKTGPAGTAKSAAGTNRSVSKTSSTHGTGTLVAVFNPETALFRWKLSFSGLKSSPKTGQFHGRDGPDAGGTSTLSFSGVSKSPMEGRANLTETQAGDLLAGRWFISLRTGAYPQGEIRGQLELHE